MDFERMMQESEESRRRCSVVAGGLFNYLRNHDRLKNAGIIFPDSCVRHCFRIEINGPGKRYTHLSISVPPDAMGNRIRDLEEGQEPSTYETALFQNGSLIYIEELDYEDVRRFGSIDELVEEILRLHTPPPLGEKCASKMPQ